MSRVSGTIDRGRVIPLKWANSSQTACWPATQNAFYSGKHVLFRAHIPAQSTLELQLAPERGRDLSLYAYMLGTGRERLPPNGASGLCEASHLYGIKTRGVTKNPGKIERIKLQATTRPYTVIIGVAGAHKETHGRFKLTGRLTVARKSIPNTGPPKIQTIQLKPNATTRVRGNIRVGKKIPLAWASGSKQLVGQRPVMHTFQVDIRSTEWTCRLTLHSTLKFNRKRALI